MSRTGTIGGYRYKQHRYYAYVARGSLYETRYWLRRAQQRGLHLLLAGRSEPALDLAFLRGKG